MTDYLLCCTKMRYDHKGAYNDEGQYQLIIEKGDGYDLTLDINYCPWCGKEVAGI